ncbi:MAG TPA: nuclear transport factor 2 family protein [Pseudomonadales bacterium]|nr:nuclear transport factor 2 family protein [Pseudomonadales bacterium]
MTESSNHPAIQANINSITFAMKGDRESWLALYADDAVVRDPVGVSPFDPSGEGHRGKAAIAKFWDDIIGPSNLTIPVHKRITSGDRSVAVHQTAFNNLGKGQTKMEMIAIYKLNDQGKICEMSAYWNWDDMQMQLKELGYM